jgi:hypothetical protein
MMSDVTRFSSEREGKGCGLVERQRARLQLPLSIIHTKKVVSLDAEPGLRRSCLPVELACGGAPWPQCLPLFA